VIGALAIIGLPPLNGFVSEWLLFQGLVHSGATGSGATAIAMPLAVAAVALAAGLAAATFVKALGTGFLALPRSVPAEAAGETHRTMTGAMVAGAAVCVVLGVLPAFVAVGVSRAVAVIAPAYASSLSVQHSFVQLGAIRGAVSPALLVLALLGGVVGLLALWRATGATRVRRGAENWGCGRTLQTARMEYTATSFAEPLQRVFDDVLRPDHDVDVSHATESRWYVQSARYRLEMRDSIERFVFVPVIALGRWVGESARALHNGSVHRYLAYGFVALCVVLVLAR
jgi:NADH:ubiquinone oxidoreductase subunit 5 (subunit L)/multisubunit Na+/H+ antiporter MnhA subunit